MSGALARSLALILAVVGIALGAGFTIRDAASAPPAKKVAHAAMAAEDPGTANGYVLLEQVTPKRIKVTMMFSGANPGRHPIHIHAGSSGAQCDAGPVEINLSPALAKRNGVIGPGLNTRVVRGTINDLLGMDAVVVLHKAPADATYISCGTIVAD